MATIKESLIVPIGKSVSLLNRTITGPTVFKREYNSEAESVTFSTLATSIDTSYWYRIIHNAGPSANNINVLYTSPTFQAQQTPDLVNVAVTGRFTIEVHHVGDITIEITGIGVTGNLREDISNTLEEISTIDQTYRNLHIRQLACMTELLEKINNNLRVIAETEDDQGDTF